MKKLAYTLAALGLISFAAPAFAGEEAPKTEEAKPSKTKKAAPKTETAPKTEAAPTAPKTEEGAKKTTK